MRNIARDITCNTTRGEIYLEHALDLQEKVNRVDSASRRAQRRKSFFDVMRRKYVYNYIYIVRIHLICYTAR